MHPVLQDEGGAVTGAACKLGWEAGSRSALQISRKLGEFGVAHHDTAGKHGGASPTAGLLDARPTSGIL
jgi:hypothetical protein